uniref:Cysteamine dioxygenase n=1 Tax=Tanacetum cinerariifolium TaxID=118510 RepID=A0A6L2NQZ0_TANCI|nr:cysteamine dioxygenase [Tanacetum cinerariifolium]
MDAKVFAYLFLLLSAELLENVNFVCSHVDCKILQKDGACYLPDNLMNHASLAMNIYYQCNGRKPWTCHFSNSGLITLTDPSYGEDKTMVDSVPEREGVRGVVEEGMGTGSQEGPSAPAPLTQPNPLDFIKENIDVLRTLTKEYDKQAQTKATPKKLTYGDFEEEGSGSSARRGLSKTKAKEGRAKSSSRRSEERGTSLDSDYKEGSEDVCEDLNTPYKRPKPTPFTSRITRFKYLRRAKLPRNIKVYEGNKDLEDHLGIISGAAEHEERPMPIWLEFSQHKRYAKDPNEIHSIKRRPNEVLQAFIDRFNSEISHIKCMTPVLRIFAFMHDHGQPELAKKLNKKIPKIVDGMLKRVRAFIRAEVATGSGEIVRVPQRDKGVVQIRCYDRGIQGPKDLYNCGSSLETMYEHCFRSFGAHTRSKLKKSSAHLVRFSGESYHPLGLVDLRVTMGEPGRSKAVLSEFAIVKCRSPCNIILGRTWMRGHEMPVTINDKLAVGCKQKLVEIIQRNVDVFSWTSVVDQRRVVKEKVFEWLKARIIRRVKYPGWATNSIPINKRMELSKRKTAFNTKEGLYCHTHMPKGLKNSEATYQRMMDKDVEETLRKLQRVNIKLNPIECTFRMEEGKFLGYTVTIDGINDDQKKEKVEKQVVEKFLEKKEQVSKVSKKVKNEAFRTKEGPSEELVRGPRLIVYRQLNVFSCQDLVFSVFIEELIVVIKFWLKLGSLPIQEKLVGASNYRSWKRSKEICLSIKRKLSFMKVTIPKPVVMPLTPENNVARTANAVEIEMCKTCYNRVISWIMSSVCESIAKSVMFIRNASEIWSQLKTRFSLSNESRKYKLSKDTFGISQQGNSVSEYYTRMECVWEELDSMNNLPRLVTFTPKMLVFLCDVEKEKEEQILFQFLNGVDDCYSAQRKSQKDVFSNGLTMIDSTTLFSKNAGKEKCSICGFKWHPPDKCWEKVGKSCSNSVFKMIHIDTYGLYKVPTNGKFKYLLTIVDYYSRETWTYLMIHKSNALEIIKAFLKFVELQFETKVNCIRSHNTLEFVKGPCALCLVDKGIEHHTSCPDRPQQNGRVERKHKYILEVARALRFQASLPLRFRGDCVTTATYLINRIPSSVLQNKTPYEMLLKKVTYCSNLRVFGCFAMAANPLRIADKFAPRGVSSAMNGWEITHMDVSNAFLHRDLFEEVYMQLLMGYVGQDDLMTTGNDTEQVKTLKRQLSSQFHKKDLGDFHYFLGFKVTKAEAGLFVSQKKFTIEMLQEAGVMHSRPYKLPMDPNLKLQANVGCLTNLPLLLKNFLKPLTAMKYSSSSLSEYECSSLALDREEMRDEKNRLDHLKQDQTTLVIKRFSKRRKVFRERKKTEKIRAKREEDIVRENVIICDGHPDQPVTINRKLSVGWIIRRDQDPGWVTNAISIKQKDGTWQVRIDFTTLNNVYPKAMYPFHEVEEKLRSFIGHRYKCFLWPPKEGSQVRMFKGDEEKTAFQTEDGVYYHAHMTKGLKNSGATYQRMMDRVPTEKKRRTVEVYLEEMVIKSKFLGYMVTMDGIKAHPKKRRTITERKLEIPIHNANRPLQGMEICYTSTEKTVLTLVHTERWLRKTFSNYKFNVITNDPREQILKIPWASGWLALWEIELKTYYSFVPSEGKSKGQVAEKFLVKKEQVSKVSKKGDNEAFGTKEGTLRRVSSKPKGMEVVHRKRSQQGGLRRMV